MSKRSRAMVMMAGAGLAGFTVVSALVFVALLANVSFSQFPAPGFFSFFRFLFEAAALSESLSSAPLVLAAAPAPGASGGAAASAAAASMAPPAYRGCCSETKESSA